MSVLEREIIGPPACPIMHRWTLFVWEHRERANRGFKLLLHHFLPNADDRDTHDHPRSFVTIVLRGSYEDLVPCRPPSDGGCGGTGTWECPFCDGDGLEVGERMRSGMIRFRSATHTHRTRVGPEGCWTLVIMGPLRRPWGFWRLGRWWPWREYEERFGFGMRCE